MFFKKLKKVFGHKCVFPGQNILLPKLITPNRFTFLKKVTCSKERKLQMAILKNNTKSERTDQ